MQRKIEIEYKQRNYIIKASDQLTFEELLVNSGLVKASELRGIHLFIESKNLYVQVFNKLKDFQVVNNDVIKVMENDEKTI